MSPDSFRDSPDTPRSAPQWSEQDRKKCIQSAHDFAGYEFAPADPERQTFLHDLDQLNPNISRETFVQWILDWEFHQWHKNALHNVSGNYIDPEHMKGRFTVINGNGFFIHGPSTPRQSQFM